MTYHKLMKLHLLSSSSKKYDLSLQSQLLFNVSEKSEVDEVLNIIFSQSSISVLVVRNTQQEQIHDRPVF